MIRFLRRLFTSNRPPERWWAGDHPFGPEIYLGDMLWVQFPIDYSLIDATKKLDPLQTMTDVFHFSPRKAILCLAIPDEWIVGPSRKEPTL